MQCGLIIVKPLLAIKTMIRHCISFQQERGPEAVDGSRLGALLRLRGGHRLGQVRADGGTLLLRYVDLMLGGGCRRVST